MGSFDFFPLGDSELAVLAGEEELLLSEPEPDFVHADRIATSIMSKAIRTDMDFLCRDIFWTPFDFNPYWFIAAVYDVLIIIPYKRLQNPNLIGIVDYYWVYNGSVMVTFVPKPGLEEIMTPYSSP